LKPDRRESAPEGADVRMGMMYSGVCGFGID
jgi:hypothetical protein